MQAKLMTIMTTFLILVGCATEAVAEDKPAADKDKYTCEYVGAGWKGLITFKVPKTGDTRKVDVWCTYIMEDSEDDLADGDEAEYEMTLKAGKDGKFTGELDLTDDGDEQYYMEVTIKDGKLTGKFGFEKDPATMDGTIKKHEKKKE